MHNLWNVFQHRKSSGCRGNRRGAWRINAKRLHPGNAGAMGAWRANCDGLRQTAAEQ